MIIQQGDVRLFQTTDDGEINVVDGIVEMEAGLETATYLSLFGGNEEDSGLDGDNQSWWGNTYETLPERQYRSETQHLLRSLPITTGSLERVKKLVENDLQWMRDTDLANSVEVEITIPRLNTVGIAIDFVMGNEKTPLYFEFYKDKVA